jgi:hypothetical protein
VLLGCTAGGEGDRLHAAQRRQGGVHVRGGAAHSRRLAEHLLPHARAQQGALRWHQHLRAHSHPCAHRACVLPTQPSPPLGPQPALHPSNRGSLTAGGVVDGRRSWHRPSKERPWPPQPVPGRTNTACRQAAQPPQTPLHSRCVHAAVVHSIRLLRVGHDAAFGTGRPKMALERRSTSRTLPRRTCSPLGTAAVALKGLYRIGK